MNRIAVVALVITSVAVAQVSKRAAKGSEEDVLSGYAMNGLLIKDEGCIKDVVRAGLSTGIEQRKQMADLVTYGCVEYLPGVYHGIVKETRNCRNHAEQAHKGLQCHTSLSIST